MATKLTKKEIALSSKSMLWLLRHGIVEKGLAMASDGFIHVADMLALPEFAGYRQVPYLRQGGEATDHNHPIRVVNRYLTSSV